MTTEKALTTKPNSDIGPASPFELGTAEYVEGTDRLTREDLQIPHLILVQGQSADIPDNDNHLGQFYNDLTGEFYGEVKAILMSVVKGRVAFPRDFSRESELLCASDDGLFPRGDYVGNVVLDTKLDIQWEIDGGPCAACPFAAFGKNSESPLCAKVYSYAMLDSERGVPFILRAQRTGAAPAKQLNTIAKMLGRRKLVKISSRKVTGDSGAYYVPVFSIAEQTPPELSAFVYRLNLEFGNIAARPQGTNGNGHDKQEASEEVEEPF